MYTYSEFRARREQGQTTCVDTLNEFLTRIADNYKLNAFLHVASESALEQAKLSDERFAAGNPRALEGMIVAIKDNISTKNIPTTCGSRLLENFSPVYDATVIQRIRNAGGIIIGKTNMDEFAMGSSNENSAFGPVEHPLGNNLVPGGSSGGSAVAVAAGLCHVSLGSDTGGSVRQPAAFCGVLGLKPSYGMISRYGLVAFASSLDQIGIFAASTEDTALMLDAISGRDDYDSTSSDMAPANTAAAVAGALPEKFTVAVLPEDEIRGCTEEVLAAYRKGLEALRNMGAGIIEARIPAADAWIPTYYILATAEASSNLARFDGVRYGNRVTPEDGDIITGTRSEGFGTEVKRRIMLGTYVLSSGYYDAYYRKAQKARRLIHDAYGEIFSKADFLYLPTTPTPAFRRGEKTSDPVAMYLSDYFTVSANLAGNAAISIPAGTTQEGLPVGVQLQVRHFDEARLLNLSAHLMKALAQA